ncbi:hypothetical protein B0T10DRAFT_167824 [Thelonectria olida]|uniref:Gem-associated protein 5 TPR domain-containing protein n=1 Tax=Thelonectria olida TaxID=1576542 RepID=A0A9P8WDF4_9HYPO|nr:hypothetical protein B0T10DRAFT_167824 [Thelonectria olida]
MSVISAQSRNRAMSINSGRSSNRGRATPAQDFTANTMPSVKNLRFFDPCAATASMFLYAQGSSIVCSHHDTLTIERRFSRHAEEVQLLAVDNHSEVGGGRFVVSYDAGQTAIVWDLMTGDEVARFASYDHLTCAAWMRNGNVAFGNTQGSIIQFEPTTSEHISSRTLDQIAVTALAPSSDCRTFAIGYQNGTLLVATLQPRFTILHNLTTSRGPSPIVTLAWHASSSRQKSDMLAVQTHDGDLRVWSVTKAYNADDPAKIVRVLRKTENFVNGPNWMGWSKNGRIIQFSESQTLSWDVRTKHVTYDSIPTLEHVRGLAVYGPGASMFSLGPNNTVQQFDLNSPSIMVANVQHPANLLPPSPPVSDETVDRSTHSVTTINTSESEGSIPLDMGISESDDDHLGPFARLTRRPTHESGNEMSYDLASPVSSRSGLSSITKSSTGSRTPNRYASSVVSRGMTENTYISSGTSIKSSTIGKRDQDQYSAGYTASTTSMSSTRSRHRPSRLRNEVPRSPDDSSRVHDLFKYTRARLSDLPYKHPIASGFTRLTNDDLRRQMLSSIFGWNREIDDLIRDEMSRHPLGSASRILLAKWLGDIDADVMTASFENMTSSDWMLLALSGIGGQPSQHKIGRAYIQRLLESGDIHAAVTLMLGMGDHNDAVEIYISHKKYMEALILACLVFPSVWERQSAIIRKWGEWAVKHGQQQLAIRCFACTDQETTEPWTSPSAAQLSFQTGTPSIPEILSPPLSPPGVQRGPQRSIAKTSALKLITSFGDPTQKARFFSQDGGATPIAAGVTPIAESAVSPTGTQEATTAFLRPSNNSRFNTPTSARPGGPSFGRGRLPSIGETPVDLNRDNLKLAAVAFEPENHPGRFRAASASQDNLTTGMSLQRAATAGPMMMRDNFEKLVRNDEVPPSPDPDAVLRLQREARSDRRNGSRDRIPVGVHLQLQPLEPQEPNDLTSPEQSVASSARFHWPSRRRGPGSVASSVTSAASTTGRAPRQRATRNRDDYIHSLDAASEYSRKPGSRQASRERSRTRHASRDRSGRQSSEERGRRADRAWPKPKRSPTSPIPMSPEDLINLSTPKPSEAGDPPTARKASDSRVRPGSRASSRESRRRRSPEGRPFLQPLDIRGRSQSRSGSMQRSPSSPLPMSANAHHYQGSEDEEDYAAAVEAQENFRQRHSRSTSRNRGVNSPHMKMGERSESRRRANSDAVEPLGHVRSHSHVNVSEHAGDLRLMKDERQRKKEQAAWELEERRKSLAKRAQTPSIPHPNQFSPALPRMAEHASPKVVPDDPIARCATEPPRSMYARKGPVIGLPATPKAMRLVLQSDQAEPKPDVPAVPSSFAERVSPQNSPKGSPGKTSPAASPKAPGEDKQDLLTLLPSTVYQMPSHPLPRSMSAPIPDEPGPARFGRKASFGGASRRIVEAPTERRRSHDDPVPPPPPPPPAPPVLKELQHLASPPPPPPAPLPYMARQQQDGGALSSGMIEIVMDEDEVSGNDAPPRPSPTKSESFAMHSRGRSKGDSTFTGRFNKATERLRSASRSRGHRDVGRVVSPPFEAPYESISTRHMKSPPPVSHGLDMMRSPGDRQLKHMSTGLHQNEMI